MCTALDLNEMPQGVTQTHITKAVADAAKSDKQLIIELFGLEPGSRPIPPSELARRKRILLYDLNRLKAGVLRKIHDAALKQAQARETKVYDQ